MFDELFKKSNYKVFIPSVQDYIEFKPLSVLQYKKIIASSYNNNFLHLGFKTSLFEVLENNKLSTDFIPTELDLYVYGLYVRYFDISQYYKDQKISLKEPANFLLEDNNKIKFRIPTVDEFYSYVEYINSLKDKTENNLLIAELAKYAHFKHTSFNEKIDFILNSSIEDLNDLLKSIDKFKASINKILQITDTIRLPFTSALILE